MQQDNPSSKIVIVEDNVELANIYQTQLQVAGYQCFVANDGIAAIYTIQTELPQMVLLDLMVPAIAGDEVLKRMRASEWGKNIPVLIISNLNEGDAPSGLRNLQIVDYLVKANLTDGQLLEVVNAIVSPSVATTN